MKINKPVLLTFALAAGAASSGAWATPLSFSSGFSVSTGSLYTPVSGINVTGSYGDFALLSLPSFDSSLGTLNSVSISFVSEVSSDLQGFASDSAEQCMFIGCEMPTIEASIWVNHFLALTAHLLNAPSTTVGTTVTQTEECSYSVTGPLGVSCLADDSPPSTGSFDSAFDLSAYSLADFIDVSNVFFAFQLESDILTYCGSTLDQECGVWRMADWNGTVNVTYDYTDSSGGSGGDPHPVPVPEPESLSLLAAGLFAVALAQRRRRGRSSLRVGTLPS